MSIVGDGRIHTFHEKPQMEAAFVNGGYMVADQRLFDYLPDDPEIMLEQEPVASLLKDGQLHSFRHEGWWQPMDTYQEMQYLERLWLEARAPWKLWCP